MFQAENNILCSEINNLKFEPPSKEVSIYTFAISRTVSVQVGSAIVVWATARFSAFRVCLCVGTVMNKYTHNTSTVRRNAGLGWGHKPDF